MRKFLSFLLVACLALVMAFQSSSAQATPPAQGHGRSTPAVQLIAKAKASDPAGFAERLGLIRDSEAFVAVLQQYTSDASLNAEFFAAISTGEQARDLAENTRGKHYVISGTLENPDVRLVDGAVETRGVTPMAMPACPKAWAAFSAWLIGTTMLCAPFSGPAAWACAAGMGFLGLMPDFNKACR